MYAVVRRDESGDFVNVSAIRSDKAQALAVAEELARKIAADIEGRVVERFECPDGEQPETFEVIECTDADPVDPYVQAKGNKCPYCGDEEVGITGPLEAGGGSAWQGCKCIKCDKEWTDVYTLTGWEPVKLSTTNRHGETINVGDKVRTWSDFNVYRGFVEDIIDDDGETCIINGHDLFRRPIRGRAPAWAVERIEP